MNKNVKTFHFGDQNPIITSIEYVGWSEEILKLDYGRFQMVVPLCNCVGTNYEWFVATIQHDDYGFILMSFEWLIPLLIQSFTFPMHIE